MGVSFANDIAPLFTDGDVECMEGQIDLRDYAFMSDPGPYREFPDHGHARIVFKRLSLPNGLQRMPRGRPPWPAEHIALFSSWMEDGFLP